MVADKIHQYLLTQHFRLKNVSLTLIPIAGSIVFGMNQGASVAQTRLVDEPAPTFKEEQIRSSTLCEKEENLPFWKAWLGEGHLPITLGRGVPGDSKQNPTSKQFSFPIVDSYRLTQSGQANASYEAVHNTTRRSFLFIPITETLPDQGGTFTITNSLPNQTLGITYALYNRVRKGDEIEDKIVECKEIVIGPQQTVPINIQPNQFIRVNDKTRTNSFKPEEKFEFKLPPFANDVLPWAGLGLGAGLLIVAGEAGIKAKDRLQRSDALHRAPIDVHSRLFTELFPVSKNTPLEAFDLSKSWQQQQGNYVVSLTQAEWYGFKYLGNDLLGSAQPAHTNWIVKIAPSSSAISGGDTSFNFADLAAKFPGIENGLVEILNTRVNAVFKNNSQLLSQSYPPQLTIFFAKDYTPYILSSNGLEYKVNGEQVFRVHQDRVGNPTVSTIITPQEVRGKGLTTALLTQAVVDWSRDRYSAFTLEDTNDDQQRLSRRAGFVKIENRKMQRDLRWRPSVNRLGGVNLSVPGQNGETILIGRTRVIPDKKAALISRIDPKSGELGEKLLEVTIQKLLAQGYQDVGIRMKQVYDAWSNWLAIKPNHSMPTLKTGININNVEIPLKDFDWQDSRGNSYRFLYNPNEMGYTVSSLSNSNSNITSRCSALPRTASIDIVLESNLHGITREDALRQLMLLTLRKLKREGKIQAIRLENTGQQDKLSDLILKGLKLTGTEAQLRTQEQIATELGLTVASMDLFNDPVEEGAKFIYISD